MRQPTVGGENDLAVFESFQAQLVLYAQDLKTAVMRERQKSAELAATVDRLHAMTTRLERAIEAERERSRDLERAHEDTLLRLNRASRMRDEETGEHIERVSRYSYVIARAYGMSEDEAQVIASAAPMHDVGKIGVLDAILGKPGPLTREERRVMETHTTIGGELLKGSQSPLINAAHEIALTHHERWDGTGYPFGLKQSQIPISGRIVMLADQYDALRSARPYKPAFTHEVATDIILKGDGRTMPSHFDPRMLALFREMELELDLIYSSCTNSSGPIIYAP